MLLNSPQPDALRFMPALNVTREEIAEMIDCLDGILTKAGAARLVADDASSRHAQASNRQSIDFAATKLDRFAPSLPGNAAR